MSKFQDPRTRCPRVGSGHPSGSAPGQRPPGEDPGAARLEADVSAAPASGCRAAFGGSSARAQGAWQLLPGAPPLRLFLGPETYAGSLLLPMSADCWPRRAPGHPVLLPQGNRGRPCSPGAGSRGRHGFGLSQVSPASGPVCGSLSRPCPGHSDAPGGAGGRDTYEGVSQGPGTPPSPMGLREGIAGRLCSEGS